MPRMGEKVVLLIVADGDAPGPDELDDRSGSVCGPAAFPRTSRWSTNSRTTRRASSSAGSCASSSHISATTRRTDDDRHATVDLAAAESAVASSISLASSVRQWAYRLLSSTRAQRIPTTGGMPFSGGSPHSLSSRSPNGVADVIGPVDDSSRRSSPDPRPPQPRRFTFATCRENPSPPFTRNRWPTPPCRAAEHAAWLASQGRRTRNDDTLESPSPTSPTSRSRWRSRL